MYLISLLFLFLGVLTAVGMCRQLLCPSGGLHLFVDLWRNMQSQEHGEWLNKFQGTLGMPKVNRMKHLKNTN